MLDPSTTQASPISSQAAGPREVVASFLRLTVDTPDLKRAKLHLTKRSVASGSFDAAAVPAGSTYTLGAEEADELGRRIAVSVKSPVPGGAVQEMTVPVIVVEEEGEWKIDLPATMERLMGGMTAALGQAMGAMGEVLTTAMSGVGEALNAGLGEVPAPVKKKASVKSPAKRSSKKIRVVKPGKKLAKKAAPKKKARAKMAKKPAGKFARKAAKKSGKHAGKSGKNRR